MELLIVDDSIEICELISNILQKIKHLNITTAISYTQAKNALATKKIDIIILDVLLPHKSGLDICRETRKMQGGQNIYILILTALSTEKDLVKGFEAGADDFLLKPFSNRELTARIKAGIHTIERIKESQNKKTYYKEELLKEKIKNTIMIEKNEELHRSYVEIDKLNKKLKTQATIDSLTQIYNRGTIIDYFQEELALSYKKKTLCTILLDADDFKKINDTHGHLIGDKVLKKIAASLSKTIRGSDFVGRYGGEEFLVLLPDTHLRQGYEIANRICKNISEIRIKTGKDKIKITVSVGVTESNIIKKEKIDDLILRSDIALYDAKENGKNQVVILSKNKEILTLK